MRRGFVCYLEMFLLLAIFNISYAANNKPSIKVEVFTILFTKGRDMYSHTRQHVGPTELNPI